MSTVFRQVERKDIAQYHQLILDAYGTVREMGIHFAAATADLPMIEEHLAFNAAYVLEEDGDFLSSISIRYPWGNNPGPLQLPHLGWFATNPKYKRQGIGKKTLRLLEEEVLIGQLQLPAVTLGTADSHPWLRTFYESCGFSEIGERDLGKGHLTIYFQKILQPSLYAVWAQNHPTTIEDKGEK